MILDCTGCFPAGRGVWSGAPTRCTLIGIAGRLLKLDAPGVSVGSAVEPSMALAVDTDTAEAFLDTDDGLNVAFEDVDAPLGFARDATGSDTAPLGVAGPEDVMCIPPDLPLGLVAAGILLTGSDRALDFDLDLRVEAGGTLSVGFGVGV